ncbi:MBL fold metallo-hydrolase [Chitinilyticum piscinae]|uniref:MBL fold metallo-hydrolase n=1 Tax=Chitinilyticum piscinae TaxID=2866724 RepID=UPI001D163633|nr:MBL fold metallo-hydrolase [Chitinilyticum piscinae]
MSLLFAGMLAGCASTTHPVKPAAQGGAISSVALEAVIDQAGPVELQTVASADWQVPLSGLLNLDDPRAKAAGLQDRPEPIQVYLHVLRHPRYGVFLVDTGVSAQLLADPAVYGIGGMLQRAMNFAQLQLRQSTETVLAGLGAPVQGVFLTHLHLDHISGLPAIDKTVPVYTGAGEADERYWLHAFVQGASDALLANRPELREWEFASGADGRPAGVIDVFGDASVFALATPGHTAGSTAYLVRTPEGPVLLAGDVSHTRWGWENGVEPGDFSRDLPGNRSSLMALRALVARHPQIRVRLGHQP